MPSCEIIISIKRQVRTLFPIWFREAFSRIQDASMGTKYCICIQWDRSYLEREAACSTALSPSNQNLPHEKKSHTHRIWCVKSWTHSSVTLKLEPSLRSAIRKILHQILHLMPFVFTYHESNDYKNKHHWFDWKFYLHCWMHFVGQRKGDESFLV